MLAGSRLAGMTVASSCFGGRPERGASRKPSSPTVAIHLPLLLESPEPFGRCTRLRRGPAPIADRSSPVPILRPTTATTGRAPAAAPVCAPCGDSPCVLWQQFVPPHTPAGLRSSARARPDAVPPSRRSVSERRASGLLGCQRGALGTTPYRCSPQNAWWICPRPCHRTYKRVYFALDRSLCIAVPPWPPEITRLYQPGLPFWTPVCCSVYTQPPSFSGDALGQEDKRHSRRPKSTP